MNAPLAPKDPRRILLYTFLIGARVLQNATVDEASGCLRVLVTLADVRSALDALVAECGPHGHDGTPEELLAVTAQSFCTRCGPDSIEWTEDGCAFWATVPRESTPAPAGSTP